MMKIATTLKEKYKIFQQKAEVDKELLASLVRGLEDIKAGRITPWKKTPKS